MKIGNMPSGKEFQIGAVPIDNLVILPQQLYRHGNIVDIGGGGLPRMDKTATRIHASVTFHTEMPLVSLFRLVHLGIPLFPHSWSSLGR